MGSRDFLVLDSIGSSIQTLMPQTPGVKLNRDDENHNDLERDAIFSSTLRVKPEEHACLFLMFSLTPLAWDYKPLSFSLSVCQEQVGVEGFISIHFQILSSPAVHSLRSRHTFPAHSTKRSPRSGEKCRERWKRTCRGKELCLNVFRVIATSIQTY